MNRRPVVRTGNISRPDQASSSEDEEDVFSALARKKEKKNSSKQVLSTQLNDNTTTSASAENVGSSHEPPSQKRHHHPSAARAAKMHSLLQELQETATHSTAIQPSTNNYDRPPPEKMGSYCLPGEELITANLFVGNLAPCTTEEELTELFRQFGDLFSVKIMWPRTEEERLRGRNTGFVCFINREDASEAMDYYQESDPLGTGHKLMIRWGKDVKNNNARRGAGTNIITSTRPLRADQSSFVKEDVMWMQSTNPSLPNKKRSTSSDHYMGRQETDHDNVVDEHDTSSSDWKKSKYSAGLLPTITSVKYIAAQHSKDAIHVIPPSDPHRCEFISTLAFYVAKDGYNLEKRIVECECNNPSFRFLHVPSSTTFSPSSRQDVLEYIFYRWRVYAFAQGDSFQSWRREPFIMLYHPQDPMGGRFWIPPSAPINESDAAGLEEKLGRGREDRFHIRQEDRRTRQGGNIPKSKDGGQLLERGHQFGTAHARVVPSSNKAALAGATVLNDSEIEEWNDIIHNRLCASKNSILEAMSFCFDRSTAAVQISQLMRTALLDDRKGISVDTRIARLFLLSDVLFNSQQPGVKNAYRYRDAIEAMAPEIFSSFGMHGQKKGEMVGRITLNKLRTAVKAVLSAWSDWSVYNTTFLEELDALFEGIQSKQGQEPQNTDTGVLSPSYEEIPANPTVSIDSDIDGEELNDDDLIPDDIDGESLSESDIVLLEVP